MTLAVVLLTAYLLGSIPTSYIVVYRLTGRDVRTLGSGVPGTMNVLDHVGVRAAVFVGLADIGKGAAAVSLAYFAGLDNAAAVAAAIVAVIGHDWSIFLGFGGGNGTATAVGGMLVLPPLPTLVGTAFAVALWLIFGSRRRAGIAGLALVPIAGYWLDAPDIRLAGVVLLIAFTVLKIARFEGFSPARPGR